MKVLYYGISLFLTLWVLGLFFPANLSAQVPIATGEVLFEDDFSSGNFNKWQDVRNNPNGTWSIVDGQAEALISKGSTLAELVPKDQYWNSSWHDIKYELNYTPLTGVDRNISFNFIDTQNWYEIHFIGGTYEIARMKNDKVVWKVNGTAPVPNNVSNHIVFIIDGNNLQIYINNKKYVDEIDPTFDASYGKIGLKAGAGSVAPTKVRFDNIKVTSLNEAEIDDGLISQPFKQSNLSWANLEYDSASQWAGDEDSDISRWGCALTSLAMIFNFHDIANMPDGSAVDPASLNNWLNSQPDGYVGEGLINWIAATRLTRIINNQFGTSKLEYSKQLNADLSQPVSTQYQPAAQEITESKPVILQIPGHFLVGDGKVTDNDQLTNLMIKDPFYDYSLFSEHDEDLISTRKFQPSQTDLSYILIVAEDDVLLSLMDANNQDITDQYLSRDFLKTADGQESKTYQVIELPKPMVGNYHLSVGSTQVEEQKLTIFTYDEQGNSTDLSQDLIVRPLETELVINYDDLGNSQIDQEYDFVRLQQDLTFFHQNGKISSNRVFQILYRYAELAATQGIRKLETNKQIFLLHLDKNSKYINADTLTYLQSQVGKI